MAVQQESAPQQQFERVRVEMAPEVREQMIAEFLDRAVYEVYPSRELMAEALRSGRRLTAYMGIDPTAPDMHVGHESQLLKLKRLQQMGHHVILLIGDYTARIGDPTDKSAARKKLTAAEVLANAKSYKEQASKILNFDDPTNPVELMYNSEWLGQLGTDGMLELAATMTVQQMDQRETFRRRREAGQPIHINEYLYPLLQGWDSVAMKVDIEIGGSDQIFNMLVGSDMIRRELGKQKFVVAGHLLVDPSGKKIGKTEGNMITLTDTPDAMFEKIMMWGDGIVPHALELCTTLPMEQVREIAAQMERGELDGRQAKLFLARTVVSELHSADAAAAAQQKYESVAKQQVNAEELPAAVFTPGASLVDALVAANLATSKSDARRKISQGAVNIGPEKITDPNYTLPAEAAAQILRVGKQSSGLRRLEAQNSE